MNELSWQKNAEKQWDYKAENWHSRSEQMWEVGSRKDIIPFLKKYLTKDSEICDLGCGDGYGSYRLAKEGYQVVGIDLSEKMIASASKREKSNLVFVKGDISETPFKNRQFNVCMAINSLEWTESPLKVLGEMNRITKTDGIACVAILGPTAMPRVHSFQRLYGEKVICHTIMPWEFKRLALENGWGILEELYVWKEGVPANLTDQLSIELRQALTFMTVFIIKKEKNDL